MTKKPRPVCFVHESGRERERWGETKERDRDSNSPDRLPRLTGGEQNDLGINGTGSPPGPSTDRVLCPGLGTGLLWPWAGLSIPRPPRRPPSRSSRRGTHRLRGIFKPSRPPLHPPLLFSFCHFLLLYLLERHLRFVINQPQQQHLFFFSLFLSLFIFFFPSPLKVHLSKLGAPRQRRLELEKNEEGGDFAG